MSRFAYIPYNGVKTGRVFGFPSLHSFLYSFGIEVSFIALAILINYSTCFMNQEGKKVFSIVAHIVSITGFYFVSWIFIDASIFTPKVELILSVLLSVVFTFILFRITKMIGNYIESLKLKIRNLFDVIIDDASMHVKDLKVWDVEVVEPTMKMLNDE